MASLRQRARALLFLSVGRANSGPGSLTQGVTHTMRTRLLMPIALALLVTGCGEKHNHMRDHAHSGDGMTRPEPPAEMKRLERMVGRWTGTATMTGAGPDGDMTFNGGSPAEWAM